jgi:hypothetical protein
MNMNTSFAKKTPFLPEAIKTFPQAITTAFGGETVSDSGKNSTMLNVVSFSPIILVCCIVFLSFSYQNYKGFVYLGFLLGLCLLRSFIFSFNEWDKTNILNKCNQIIQYGEYGSASMSSFIFGFTFMYIIFPMLYNKEVNVWILISLGLLFSVDVSTRITNSCITFANYISNFLFGGVASIIILSLMYAGGSGKYLFFNELSNNSEVCSKPDKQTFKCKVYKNGQFVQEL